MLSASSRTYIEPILPSSKFFVTWRSNDVYPAPPGFNETAVQGAPLSKVPSARHELVAPGMGDDQVNLLASWIPHGRPNEPVATMRCFATAFDWMNGYSAIDDWSNE